MRDKQSIFNKKCKNKRTIICMSAKNQRWFLICKNDNVKDISILKLFIMNFILFLFHTT